MGFSVPPTHDPLARKRQRDTTGTTGHFLASPNGHHVHQTCTWPGRFSKSNGASSVAGALKISWAHGESSFGCLKPLGIMKASKSGQRNSVLFPVLAAPACRLSCDLTCKADTISAVLSHNVMTDALGHNTIQHHHRQSPPG